VPAIVDDGFALSESNAIAEYLDERNPEKPLLPKDVKARAVARRLIAEVASELEPIIDPFSEATLYTKPEERDSKLIAEKRAKLDGELARWADTLKGDFFAGSVGLVDYALFPWVRMLSRIEERAPGFGYKPADLPPKLAAWVARIEKLPYYERTIPPHWRG
jgi:glutathione S-transferase